MGIRSSSSSSRGTRGSPRSLAVFCCTRFLTVRLPSAPLLRQVESWSGFLAAVARKIRSCGKRKDTDSNPYTEESSTGT
ncbi:hypothetical protein MUK42_07548 [Musa troglodytarum]|uniref:Uncharacterized protein n=1 Tax=Musa troglodytarum TaxID=320322 RepID=A0A9E7L2J8_9LILI|nr:hypothetical protein MUK42_07548 [Musa troglodytarum]